MESSRRRLLRFLLLIASNSIVFSSCGTNGVVSPTDLLPLEPTNINPAPLTFPASQTVITMVAPQTHTSAFEIDASDYAIDTTTAPGFDLVQIAGMELLKYDDGPVLPGASIDFRLPSEATVTDIVVTSGGETNLGSLNIPSFTAADDIAGGDEGGYEETPDTIGVFPVQPYQMDIAYHSGVQMVTLTVIPIVYDTTTNQATLYGFLSVQVDYSTPVEIMVTGVTPDKSRYLSGDTINTSTILENIGDNQISLRGTSTLEDSLGRMVGFQESESFSILPRQSYSLSFAWKEQLGGGTYHSTVTVVDAEGNTIGAVSQSMQVYQE